MRSKYFLLTGALLATVILQGCKHPLAIVGEGDIVEVGSSGRGCSLEQFRAGERACAENEVSGDYFVNYRAVPRPGWRFVRWEGPCPADSDFQHCQFAVPGDAVAQWDNTYPDRAAPPTTAVFQPVEGETGYLLAGTPVAGVSYRSATQQGVTGLDGSFQYEEGETVRFSIGATVLGTVHGQARVTPFELAGSPVLSGATVSLQRVSPIITPWALLEGLYPPQAYAWQGTGGYGSHFFQQPDPFDTVTDITVLLQSLDEDAAPGNGIVIKAGVANLFRGIRLELRRQENPLPGDMQGEGTPGAFPTLRYKLAQANRNRLFSVAHGPVGRAVALQHLYRDLGLPDRTYAICQGEGLFESSDPRLDCRYDANGNLIREQRKSGKVTRYQYNARGQLTRQQAGQSVWSWQYNTLGDPVRATQDEDGDGEPERIETWQYDRFGNVTRYEEDDGADGTLDSVITSDYDARGRPVRSQEQLEDPREGSIQTWQYYPDGRLQRYEEADIVVSNGLELARSNQVWRYDTRGRLTRYRSGGADIPGFWGLIETREYDDQGNFWRKQYSGEESPTAVTSAGHYQFDAAGRLSRYTRDNNLDGKREELQTWQYDAQGRVVRYMRDVGFDSQPDYIEIWRYAADGRTVLAEGSDAAGRLIYSRRWQYNANHRLTRYIQDGSAQTDSSPEEPALPHVETWQYNPRGDLTRHTTDRGDEEILIDNWLYDEDGNLTRFERNYDFSGAPGPIESWTFHATGWGHLFPGGGLN